MAATAFVVALVCALFVASACADQLIVVESGVGGRRGPVLRPGAAVDFCPGRYPRGFTVKCELRARVPKVDFFVNGRYVRSETKAPYVLTSNVKAFFKPWRSYPKVATINCKPVGRKPLKAILRITCRGARPAPKRPAPIKPAPIKPAPKKPTAAPKMPAPKMPAAPAPGGMSKAKCIKISAFSYIGRLSNGWVKQGSGLTFKPNDNSKGTSPGGAASLTYKFTPKFTAKYAVTVDMSTSGGVDYNDIWLKFPFGKGFELRKGTQTKSGGTGFNKAYHNKNGRAILAFTIDFQGYSFSTANVLTKGKTYTIIVGGRSHKTTVHNVYMFPCAGTQCHQGSGYWTKYVGICK